MSRRLHDQVDLGIAVDTEEGLFVPVLRDAGTLEAEILRQALEHLRDGVAKRSLPPRDFSGQTITLSNFGAMGGRYASMVVVPPQVAILGAGRAAPQVVAVDGKPTIHRVLPLSLTFDHRAVTGGEATRFLAAVVADLEKET
jgi:pyruvate dehydrogenase E2 component (dihydrolipoamide acetyltransferase)